MNAHNKHVLKFTLENLSSYLHLILAIGIPAAVGVIIASYFLIANGGKVEYILFALTFIITIAPLFIISGLRCAGGILTNTERRDVSELQKLKIVQRLHARFFQTLNLDMCLAPIVVLSNAMRWVAFLTCILSVMFLVVCNGSVGGLICFCLFAILWFPLFDRMFFYNVNYVVIMSIKSFLTILALIFFI